MEQRLEDRFGCTSFTLFVLYHPQIASLSLIATDLFTEILTTRYGKTKKDWSGHRDLNPNHVLPRHGCQPLHHTPTWWGVRCSCRLFKGSAAENQAAAPSLLVRAGQRLPKAHPNNVSAFSGLRYTISANSPDYSRTSVSKKSWWTRSESNAHLLVAGQGFSR